MNKTITIVIPPLSQGRFIEQTNKKTFFLQ